MDQLAQQVEGVSLFDDIYGQLGDTDDGGSLYEDTQHLSIISCHAFAYVVDQHSSLVVIPTDMPPLHPYSTLFLVASQRQWYPLFSATLVMDTPCVVLLAGLHMPQP